MSDTPRTDAVAYKPEEEPTPSLMLMEMTMHAKTLERELTAAKAVNMGLAGMSTEETWRHVCEAKAPRGRLEELQDLLPDPTLKQGVERLQNELRDAHAREAQLRAALQALYDLGSLELVDSRNRALRKAHSALTLPAPPVVPTDDVKPLVAVLQRIRDDADQYADGAPDASAHDKMCLELCHLIQPVLTTFATKHTFP